MPDSQPILSLKAVRKMFGPQAAVDSIDLDIAEGEFFTIVGPSGSGKTTMLRMLAGMDTPTSGDILLRGERINDIPANKRPTCMVFQSLALFPAPHGRPEHRVPAEDPRRGAGEAQGARAAADGSPAPAAVLLRQERAEMFRRRTPARGPGPGAGL